MKGKRTLEGDLYLYNEDHYVCSGDVFVKEADGEDRELALVIRELFNTDHRKMGAVGSLGKKWGRVRITVERL